MPAYKVISPGFYNGHLYNPEGKRKVLITDKPFKKGKMPSWVEPMPKKATKADEAAIEAAMADVAADEAAIEAAKADEAAIEAASFMGAGESANGADKVIETI